MIRTEFRCQAAGLLVLATLMAGCGPADEERTFDLVESFPIAEIQTERHLIDFGTPASRGHLGFGWSRNKATKKGVTYAWGQGKASSLHFFLSEVRDLDVTLRCFPAKLPDTIQQGISVVLNDREITTLDLEPSPTRYNLRLPAQALRAGSNSLIFRYASGRLPAEAGRSSNRRRLAVGWDYLEFANVTQSDEPLARIDTVPRLYVPFGSAVTFYMETRGEGYLHMEDLAVRGDSGGRLQMAWEVDGEPPRDVTVDKAAVDKAETQLGLPDHQGEPLRLTLRAVGRQEGDADWQGVVLTRPVVRWRSGSSSQVQVAPRQRELKRPSRPNVLIYLVDTLRADRLGCYGQSLPLTPEVDRLAAEGVIFERAIAQTSWTKPAVASILTGLGPVDHGVHRPEDALPATAETLSELLAAAGYRSAAFVANPHITTDSGFAQGFDHFDFSNDLAQDLNTKALAWLTDTEAAEKPFFLYVHTLDVHRPYEPMESFRQRFAPNVDDAVVKGTNNHNGHGDGKEPVTDTLIEDVWRLYNAEVAQNDAAFGALWEGLRQRGLDDDTIIVFISDHGEAFYEHDMFGHWWDLYQQVLEVPFILRIPGEARGVRVSESIQQVDLMPTLLDALGLAIPPQLRGRSLLPLINEASDGQSPPIYSYMVRQDRKGLSIVWGDWKLIEPLGGGFIKKRGLYRPWKDRAEQHDLSKQHPVLFGYLASLARAELLRLDHGLEAREVVLDAATRDSLKALGYIQ